MNKKTIFVLATIAMLACAVPFAVSEDSDALKGNSNLGLDYSSALIYQNGNNSFTFTANLTDAPAGTTGADICWKFNDLGDGMKVAYFNADKSATTASGISATVYAGKVCGSIEVEAYVAGNPDCYASAIVVVKERAGTSATEFHYFFQIKEEAWSVATANGADIVLPAGYTEEQFRAGFWIDVELSETGLAASAFNANSALQWYLGNNGWSSNIASSGWIQDLLGLGTYGGDDGVWYYWAQYHASNGGWQFNNTTLDYIDTVDESYIGMIFWGSPGPDDVPDFPGYPA